MSNLTEKEIAQLIFIVNHSQCMPFGEVTPVYNKLVAMFEEKKKEGDKKDVTS